MSIINLTLKGVFITFLVICLIGCSQETSDIEIAHSLLDKEQYADSIFYYSKVIEDNPSVADNYYFRGSAWVMKENYDLSITDFSQAIELDNYHLKAYVNMGRVWEIKGELEKALKDFNKALELQPSDLNTLEERSEIFCVTGNFNKSINDLTLLINKKHNLSNSYRQRGDARGQIFDYDGAIKDFLKSIEFNPKNTDAYNNLAWLQATCLDERYRDGYKSVYNAKKRTNYYQTIHQS